MLIERLSFSRFQMSNTVLGKAGQAEILRASQKDQFFVSHLAQVRVDVCKYLK